MAKIRKKTRVVVGTLGCKLNQAESELLVRDLLNAGYEVVSPDSAADVYILNTCTVTQTADRKARQKLRAFNRKNPDALIIATGCYAERAHDELSQLGGVGQVLGNEEKTRIAEILKSSMTTQPLSQDESSELPDGFRTRAFIKVQDGCTNFCAYCIVPIVRGKEESLSADEIVSQIKELAQAGYREVVLTGTEIGTYYCKGLALKDLIQRVLSETEIARLRLSSLQPQEITPDFIALWKKGRLCRHFHLSLQSGSNRVLLRMKRKYTAQDYSRAVSLIRAEIPDAAITTDIITGFPGETDAEFQESYNFCREIDFSRIHVFQYSKRPGTLAAKMPEQVRDKIKKERSQKMLALSGETARSFIQKFIGKRVSVLWEQPQGNSIWSGLTDNYIRIYAKSDEDLTNIITEVTLTKLYRDGGWGE